MAIKKRWLLICGETWGKIRAMINCEGKMIEEALPQCQLKYWHDNTAFAGAEFQVTMNEEEAKNVRIEKDRTLKK